MISPHIGITNYHVLNADRVNVIYKNGEYFKIIEILDYSEENELDYIIFKTEYQSSTYLTISEERPRIGEDIFAIGSPQGLENSLTKGAVSAFRGKERIQIDATIDHGSSGGPLFNLKGEVIGITSSGLGTGSELNFAIDIQSLPYKKYIQN
ncbi:S1C family serine protease [Christiangramia portivictoriae]|uniref:S1C family serine protease n=1 Tax=Christiangramia portivictoriae TaxID=326069 RepID=UPI0003F75771|nr:serine protease [Christiangramia portivictoriae]